MCCSVNDLRLFPLDISSSSSCIGGVAYGILLGVSGTGGGASFVSTISTSSDRRLGTFTEK